MRNPIKWWKAVKKRAIVGSIVRAKTVNKVLGEVRGEGG